MNIASKRKPIARLGGISIALSLALAASAALAGCSSETEGASATLRANVEGMDFEYSSRDRDASYDANASTLIDLATATITGAGASMDEGQTTISVNEEGTYILQGECADVQIRVSVGKEEKVHLVLAGASLSTTEKPALFVEEADKVFVTLAEDSSNAVSGGEADNDDDALNGAIYSKADIAFNGTGALDVQGQGENCHAIVSKDDLIVTGGNYTLKAQGNGLHGKDCVKVCGGNFSIEVDGDGIKSNNDEDATRGFVSIDGGEFNMAAGDDGIDAQHYFRVTNGTISLEAADDAFHSESDGAIMGGVIDLSAGDDAFHAEYLLTVDDGTVNVGDCQEGYEAQEVYVNGATSIIKAKDDGINAAAADDGTSENEAGTNGTAPTPPNGNGADPANQNAQDGSSADNAANPPDPPSGAGVEGDGAAPADPPNANDASANQNAQGDPPADTPKAGNANGAEEGNGTAPPDAPNANGEVEGTRSSQDGQGVPPSGDAPNANEDADPHNPQLDVQEECVLQINGGTLEIHAGGDGLDSNGSLEINGGVVLISTPSSGGNGAIDYGTTSAINGGTVLAAGSKGMAAGFSAGDQASAIVDIEGAANETLALCSSAGDTLAEFTPTESYQCVVVSSPALTEGDAFTLMAGDESVESTMTQTSGVTQGQAPGAQRDSGMSSNESSRTPSQSSENASLAS